MKLSVIVPCYNVGKYLENCVNSILKNKVSDMEIILVNDGSTDNTLEIIRKFEKKHKNIKVIDQKNQGLSMARNVGIEIASGDYIAFIDSDDSVDKQMFSKMIEKALENDFDIVACGVKWIYPDHELNIDAGFNCDCLNKDEVKKIMSTIYPGACNKIYKRSVLGKLRFKKGIWYEDVEFIYRLLPLINKIGVIEGSYYNYYQREGSITYTYNKKLYDLIDNLEGLVKYYKDNKCYDDYYEELEYTCVRYSYATFIKRLAKMKDKKEFNKGVEYAMDFINKRFPKYKSNKYLVGKKGMYLKLFNKLLANVIFYVERNKKN